MRIIEHTFDLASRVPVTPTVDMMLVQGDADAHVWRAVILRGGAAETLEGCAVTAWFDLPGGYTVPVDCTVDGNAVECVLPESVYAEHGMVSAMLRASRDGVRATLGMMRMHVRSGHADAVLDPEGLLPNVDALIAKIAQMEQATESAKGAADTALAAADAADSATVTMTQLAQESAAYARDIGERLDDVLRVGYVEPDYLWEMGYISETSGLILTDGYNGTRRCSTGGYIALRAGDFVACDEGYSARMYVYAASGQVKPDSTVPSGDFSPGPIVTDADCFVRITARRADGAEVTVEEIAQHVRVTLRTAVVRAVEDARKAAQEAVDEAAGEAVGAAMDGKLDKPSVPPAQAGKVLRVTAVNEDGSFVCEWGDAPTGGSDGVQDVRINGESIVTDGVANMKLFANSFVMNATGIYLRNANNAQINARSSNIAVSCINIDYSVKAAMCDGKGIAWTEDEQAAARARLGIVDTPTTPETPTQTVTQTPTVYCWGDSLTEGVGGWLATPEGVQNTIVSAYPDMVARCYPCVNLGCRGETIQTIMARQGADPMVVGGFTIPASADEDVVVGYLRGGYFDDNRLGIATASGDLAQPLKETESGINPCLIAGVEGTLCRDYTADSEGRYAYRFRRMADGNAVTVDTGTQIETYAMRYYRNGVAVIWMGANGSVASHTAYIDKIKQMVAYGNYDNYLVLIAREYTSQWVLEDAGSIAKALTDTDGVCHLLYLPPELIRRGYTLAGIAASAGVPDTSGWSTEDAILRSAPLMMYSSGGASESSFETLHFSAYGYKAIGKMVVERLGKLIGVQMSSGGSGSGSTDKGYVTDGEDEFGSYAYKLTRPMTGVGNAVNTGVKLYDAEKDWTIAVRFKDDMVVTDGSIGCVFELRKYFSADSVQTAAYLRLLPQTGGSMVYNFAGGFGGFNFPFDNCPGYAEPTDGYHTAVIAKSGGNYEFYLDGGLAYNAPLGYAVTEDHLTDEPLYLFGRVEGGSTYNTVTGTIADFRVYNAYFNKTVVESMIGAMTS